MSRVTVLMAVYNAERYLRQAVESILKQTFRDLEFVIVNDGSTDGSRDIILSYTDERIRLFDNNRNLGLTLSLNRGLGLAQGTYVARQDADDVSRPERLEKQVDYLDRHPEVGLLGTWTEFIAEDGAFLGVWQTPLSHALIKWQLLFANCLAHTSVVMRSSVVERVGGYSEYAFYAQDYDLWSRMSLETQIANLSEFLVQNRVHSETVSARHPERQEEVERQVVRRAISRMLGQDVGPEVVVSLDRATRGRPLGSASEVRRVAQLVQLLYGVYLEEVALSPADWPQVRGDAAQRLVDLASNTAYVFKKAAFSVLCQAIALDPGLLTSLRPVKVGLRLLGFRRKKHID